MFRSNQSKPKSKILPHLLVGVLATLMWLCLVILCSGQSIVTFKSGSTIECTLIEYANGVFHVQLPDGSRRVTSLDNIVRIQFDPPTVEPLPIEFGISSSPMRPVVASQEVASPGPPAQAPAMTPQATTSRSTSKLTLASNWQLRLAKGTLALKDTVRLLARCGTPQIDLDGKDITIWGKITYLMPMNEAKKILGLGISTRSSLTCAAFAPNSFFYHAFSGRYEEGFNRMYIITDYADNVVGVQWQDNATQDKKWFPNTSDYSQDWSQYNFVDDRRKGNPNWEIGFYVCHGNRVIQGTPPRTSVRDAQMSGVTGVNPGIVRVDSDLFSQSRDRFNLVIDTKLRERNRLLLAQPIVDLMLYVSQQSR